MPPELIATLKMLLPVLAGAILSWLPLAWQLWNDNRQKTKAREFDYRNQCYSDLPQAIADTMVLLNVVADWDVPDEEITRLSSRFAPAIYRMHPAASNETIEAAMKYFFLLTEKLKGLLLLRLEMKKCQFRMAEHEQVLKTLNDQKTNLVSTVARDANQYVSVRQELEKKEREIAQAWRRYHQAQDDRFAWRMKIAREAAQAAPALASTLVRVNVAIRREMGLSFDEERYIQQVTELTKLSTNTQLEFYSKLEDEYSRATSHNDDMQSEKTVGNQ